MPRFNFTFQDASPLISYTDGLWTEGNPANDTQAALYDGSFKVTNSSNAHATFKFLGTGVTVFGALRDNHGDYSFSLDRIGGNSVSGKGNAFRYGLWHSHDLALEEHTVEATNEPLGSDLYFDLDYVTIERVIGNDSDTIFHSEVDDTASTVQYHGSWQSNLTATFNNYNNTAHFTTTPNSRVEFTFRGCCVELYGLYTNAGYNVSLDGGPPVAMQGVDVDLPQDMWHPQTLLYLMDGLSESTHTVSLVTTKTTEQRPFSFDYAVVRSTQNFTGSSNSVTTKTNGLSRNAQVGLVVGLSLGSALLFGLLIVAYFLHRRRQLDPVTRKDWIDPDPFEIPRASIPSRFHTHTQHGPVTSTESTFQLSSIISGWHRISGIEGQSSVADSGRRTSTLWWNSSNTQSSGSRRGSVHPSPSSQTVTRHGKSEVARNAPQRNSTFNDVEASNHVPPAYDLAWGKTQT